MSLVYQICIEVGLVLVVVAVVSYIYWRQRQQVKQLQASAKLGYDGAHTSSLIISDIALRYCYADDYSMYSRDRSWGRYSTEDLESVVTSDEARTRCHPIMQAPPAHLRRSEDDRTVHIYMRPGDVLPRVSPMNPVVPVPTPAVTHTRRTSTMSSR